MQVDTHLPRGPNGARRSSTIVVGYDGSAESRRALATAASRAGDGGTVVAVYATAPPSDPLGTPFYARAVERRRDRARRILGQLADVDPGHMTVEAELADGPAPEALARVTESRDASAIIIGSRDLGRFHAALSSVSQQLVRTADRPVVVVPHRAVRAGRRTESDHARRRTPFVLSPISTRWFRL